MIAILTLVATALQDPSQALAEAIHRMERAVDHFAKVTSRPDEGTTDPPRLNLDHAIQRQKEAIESLETVLKEIEKGKG